MNESPSSDTITYKTSPNWNLKTDDTCRNETQGKTKKTKKPKPKPKKEKEGEEPNHTGYCKCRYCNCSMQSKQ
jgi:hypothetical protein